MNTPILVKRKIISWRNFERFYPFIFSIIGLITYFLIPKNDFIQSVSNKFTSPEFLNTFITVEATLFGFLLTVLTIILQMNNNGIKKLKELNRYNELIQFGKEAVISSLILLLLSILIILLKGDVEPTVFLTISHYLLGVITIYNILATIRFTDIFFVMSKLYAS